jgi:hypothetical protein
MFRSPLFTFQRALGTLALGCALLCADSVPVLAQDQPASQLNYSRPMLTGSWLVTYDVPAFFVPIPVLLSFTGDGIILETDSPMPTPFGGNIGTLVLSNGHGSWKPTGKQQFAYTYRKILYDANGASFGLARTNGAVTLNKEGTELQAKVAIQFTDNHGQVVFSAQGTVTGQRIEVQEP